MPQMPYKQAEMACLWTSIYEEYMPFICANERQGDEHIWTGI